MRLATRTALALTRLANDADGLEMRPVNDAGASELSRSDNDAHASTAAQSVRTSGVRYAQTGRKEASTASQSGKL